MKEEQFGISKTNWMESLKDVIKDRRLNEIVFPGTHDSGTYSLTKKIAPDAEDIVKKMWNSEVVPGIEDFILEWAQCQSMNIYNQLQQGIRYIDLRICYVDDIFYTCHSLIGNPIDVLLRHIAEFLKENVYEIVYIKVGFKFDNLGNDREGKKNAAKKFISDIMDNLYGEAHINPETYNDIVKSGKRAIFDYGDSIEGNYANKDSNSEVLNFLEKLDWASPNNGSMFEVQLQLTAQIKMFIISYIQKKVPEFLKNFYSVPASVSELSDASRTVVKDFFEWYAKARTIEDKAINKIPSLILSDFFERIPVVDIAICINKFNTTPTEMASQINSLTAGITNEWNPAGSALKDPFQLSAKELSDILYALNFNTDYISELLSSAFQCVHIDICHIPHIDTPEILHVDTPFMAHCDVGAGSVHVDTPHTPHVDTPHADVGAGPHTDFKIPPFGPHVDQQIMHLDTPHYDAGIIPHADVKPHVDTPLVPHVDTTPIPHVDTGEHIDVGAGSVHVETPQTQDVDLPHLDLKWE